MSCRAAAKIVTILITGMLLAGCGTWRGIANVPLPGGPGSQPHALMIYVQVPDTLGLNVNSRVRVGDVFVGTVRAIELRNWVATLTVDLKPGISLPANSTAKIGQTSLLGTQHLELAAPLDPTPQTLRDGDTIPLQRSQSYPTTERTLASVASVLNGGGLANLDAITTEVTHALDGHADAIREFLGRLDTFTTELNNQTADITRAIDATARLVDIAARNNAILDRALTVFPPLIAHLADQKEQLSHSITAVGHLAETTDEALAGTRQNLESAVKLLQRPLEQFGRGAPYLPGALHLMLTLPYHIDEVPKVVRGDYINVSPTIDLTLSAIDNGFLSGTRFSGALRALEQSWGRDPATMIPDVRYTPNPNSAPGGPLIERGN